MKNIFLYLSGFITLLLNFQSTDLQAENPVIIKGRIIDEHKQPIPFATVYITIPQNPTERRYQISLFYSGNRML